MNKRERKQVKDRLTNLCETLYIGAAQEVEQAGKDIKEILPIWTQHCGFVSYMFEEEYKPYFTIAYNEACVNIKTAIDEQLNLIKASNGILDKS